MKWVVYGASVWSWVKSAVTTVVLALRTGLTDTETRSWRYVLAVTPVVRSSTPGPEFAAHQLSLAVSEAPFGESVARVEPGLLSTSRSPANEDVVPLTMLTAPPTPLAEAELERKLSE